MLFSARMISLQQIEALAPDQASLAAARKLLDGKNWPLSEITVDKGFIWGECQGSGSTPYRTCVALADLGYKCSCPSRKFPCKHSLALMWRYQQNPGDFTDGSVPQWVLDWSSKRRGGKAGVPNTGTAPSPVAGKDIASALAEHSEQDTVKDAERASKARERNQQQREASIQAGLEDFSVWLADVYDRGLLAFAQNCSGSCRQAAKRLVDAKAAGLASQLDELAAGVMQIGEAQRPRYLHQQLSSLYLLANAYQKQLQLPEALRHDVRRLVGWNLSREQLLEATDAEHATGLWRVLAVREYLQNDGLRRTETWLESATAPADNSKRFAVLVDYYHVSAGIVAPPFQAGERLEGTVVYFPSATPLRGILVDCRRSDTPPVAGKAGGLADALAERLAQRARNPWLPNWPLSIAKPQIFAGHDGQFWLAENGNAVPLKQAHSGALLALIGVGVERATITWDGWRADLLHADTAYGFWSVAS